MRFKNHSNHTIIIQRAMLKLKKPRISEVILGPMNLESRKAVNLTFLPTYSPPADSASAATPAERAVGGSGYRRAGAPEASGAPLPVGRRHGPRA